MTTSINDVADYFCEVVCLLLKTFDLHFVILLKQDSLADILLNVFEHF